MLDVTFDPYVAMWFASTSLLETSGSIIRYKVKRNSRAFPEEVQSWNDLTDASLKGHPVLYTPKALDNRIRAQSSGFLITVLDVSLTAGSIFKNASDENQISVIGITSELKSKIICYLEKSRGIREFDIFPDFIGYAISNSQHSPFRRDINSLYDGSKGIFPLTFLEVRDGSMLSAKA